MATTTSKEVPAAGAFYKTSVTTNADGSLKTTTSKSSSATGTYTPVVSTTVGKDGKASAPVFEGGATADDKSAFSNPTSEQSKAQNTAVSSLKPYGDNPTAEQKAQLNTASGNKNAATASTTAGTGETTPKEPPTADQKAAAEKEADSFKSGTRTTPYGDFRYPLGLKLEVQDVIKFTILKYKPSLSGGATQQTGRIVTLESGIPIVSGSEKMGTITLPIPAGINDGNFVGWSMDEMSKMQ